MTPLTEERLAEIRRWAEHAARDGQTGGATMLELLAELDRVRAQIPKPPRRRAVVKR